MILHVEGFKLIYYTKKMVEKRRRTRHLKNAQNPATGEKPVRRTREEEGATVKIKNKNKIILKICRRP